MLLKKADESFILHTGWSTTYNVIIQDSAITQSCSETPAYFPLLILFCQRLSALNAAKIQKWHMFKRLLELCNIWLSFGINNSFATRCMLLNCFQYISMEKTY